MLQIVWRCLAAGGDAYRRHLRTELWVARNRDLDQHLAIMDLLTSRNQAARRLGLIQTEPLPPVAEPQREALPPAVQTCSAPIVTAPVQGRPSGTVRVGRATAPRGLWLVRWALGRRAVDEATLGCAPGGRAASMVASPLCK